MAALGLFILIGWNKSPEAHLVQISLAWLTELTTRF
jgi:hypothetical protein